MKVITETELRDIFKKTPFTSFDLPNGTKLTPAASQFLSERKIVVLRDGVSEKDLAKEDKRFNVSAPTPAYPQKAPEPLPIANPKKAEAEAGDSNLNTKNVNPQKAEHMTHIRGAHLVPKSHPVISFRGKLDTFEAILLDLVTETESVGLTGLAKDLSDLLEYSRQMMKAEVTEQPLQVLEIRGWTPKDIRERSHYPKKFYGVNHFTPQPSHGRIMARMNYLRTQARELELAAVRAFYSDDGTTRDDILQAVNRFSSLIYVFMIELLAGEYKYGA